MHKIEHTQHTHTLTYAHTLTLTHTHTHTHTLSLSRSNIRIHTLSFLFFSFLFFPLNFFLSFLSFQTYFLESHTDRSKTQNTTLTPFLCLPQPQRPVWVWSTFPAKHLLSESAKPCKFVIIKILFLSTLKPLVSFKR